MIYQLIYYAFSHNCKPLYWFIFFMAVFLTLSLLLLPESPKFYYSKNQFDKCRSSLAIIARVNRVGNLDLVKKIRFDIEGVDGKGPRALSIEQKASQDPTQEASSEIVEQEAPVNGNQVDDEDVETEVLKLEGNFKEIFQVWQIRRNFFVLMFILSVCSFYYYQFNLGLGSVPGSLLTNTLSSQIAEVSADIIAGIVYTKIGAKASMFISFTIASVGSICLILV